MPAESNAPVVEPGADDSPSEAALRADIRAWMDGHAAQFGRSIGPLVGQDTEAHVNASRSWQHELDEGGWGAVTWPVQFGGRGFGPNENRIFGEEQGRYAMRTGAQHIAVMMVGPTIIAHGTPEQHERLLAPIRGGAEIYCQLFSEPDAGSDLASLRTSAVRDGTEWVITGQKIWSSGAQHADKAIVLARSDPSLTGRDGITYFLMDMRQPGVEVRPIVQINGARHFNEVFLDGARVSQDDVLGPVAEGWTVARTTLGAERVMIGSIRVDHHIRRLIEHAQRTGRNEDPVIRQALAELWTRAAVLQATSDRVLGALRFGGTIGPEASILKLSLSTLFGRIGDVAMDVLGPEGLLSGAGDEQPYGPLQEQFLVQWAPRIGGGTEQMQRNMIGERVLGLPREPPPATTPPVR